MPRFQRLIKTALSSFNNVISIIKAIFLILFFSALRPKLPRIKTQATECVILGNGPSLKNTLSEKRHFLKNKMTMCTNDFADSPSFREIKPDYYIFTDPAFWSTDLSEKFKSTFEKYFEILKNDVSWPMTIFFPAAARQTNFCRTLPQLNSQISICYINTTAIQGPKKFQYFLYKHNFAMPLAQNVLIAAIFTCINLGFKKIYLTGADHSWHESFYVSENNILYLKNTRFQDKKIMHLSPFFEDAAEMKPYKMHNLLLALSRMFRGYMEIEEYSKYRGVKIFNASEKSYIDAFERYKIN